MITIFGEIIFKVITFCPRSSQRSSLRASLIRRDESIDDESLPLVMWAVDAGNGNGNGGTVDFAPPPQKMISDASDRKVEVAVVAAGTPDPSFQVTPDPESVARFDPADPGERFNAVLLNPDVRLVTANPDVRFSPLPLPPNQDEEPKYARVDVRHKRGSKLGESRGGTPVRHRKRE
jgi:hypothetical protein